MLAPEQVTAGVDGFALVLFLQQLGRMEGSLCDQGIVVVLYKTRVNSLRNRNVDRVTREAVECLQCGCDKGNGTLLLIRVRDFFFINNEGLENRVRANGVGKEHSDGRCVWSSRTCVINSYAMVSNLAADAALAASKKSAKASCVSSCLANAVMVS